MIASLKLKFYPNWNPHTQFPICLCNLCHSLAKMSVHLSLPHAVFLHLDVANSNQSCKSIISKPMMNPSLFVYMKLMISLHSQFGWCGHLIWMLEDNFIVVPCLVFYLPFLDSKISLLCVSWLYIIGGNRMFWASTIPILSQLITKDLCMRYVNERFAQD
jgi:hypothetical protein